MAEVSFKTALKLMNDFNHNDSLIYVKREDDPEYRGEEVMTVKMAKDRFDLQKEKVVHIRSYFTCGEYSGYLYTLKGGQKACT